jgi:hypothetical protein
MGYVYIIVALVALGGGGYGVWSYKEAIAGKETAEARAKEFQSAYDHLASALPRIQENANAEAKLARERGNRAVVAEREADMLRKELEDAKRQDPLVANWAVVPVPDVVRMSVESLTAGRGADVPRTDQQSGTDGRASVSSSNERGPDRLHPEVRAVPAPM